MTRSRSRCRISTARRVSSPVATSSCTPSRTRARDSCRGGEPSRSPLVSGWWVDDYLPRLVVYGRRASLARLVLPVQRLLGGNLAAVLIHVMDIERSIRMQEERTRSADAGELVHMFDGRVRKPAGVQVHRGFALHFHPARAAHHHQLLVGRMKVPGRATAFRALDQEDRRPVRWVTPFNRQREAVGESRILLELTGGGVLSHGFVGLLSDRGSGHQG